MLGCVVESAFSSVNANAFVLSVVVLGGPLSCWSLTNSGVLANDRMS